MCHDKKRETEAFSCWSETVKERFSALAMEAKGPIVHQWRLSLSAGDPKGYLAYLYYLNYLSESFLQVFFPFYVITHRGRTKTGKGEFLFCSFCISGMLKPWHFPVHNEFQRRRTILTSGLLILRRPWYKILHNKPKNSHMTFLSELSSNCDLSAYLYYFNHSTSSEIEAVVLLNY